MNRPLITTVLSNITEATDIKTITFRSPGDVKPGQFFMIWIPGVDEIPMSVSQITKNVIGITFRNIGDATQALSQLQKGDQIGIRG
ncbi:MAG TPA: dihydroorotate dehydrogenase electron transfer subunit, partial [Thermoplasmata archaeon]|nr:dihydroorotate dehydrogenase electron transfer subunit [Thermoplasmata archaeon]